MELRMELLEGVVEATMERVEDKLQVGEYSARFRRRYCFINCSVNFSMA